MQVICRVKAPFSLCGDREEFAIAKKLQRCRDFCFRDGLIVPTGRFHDGWIAPNGWISQGGGHRNGANHADVRILGGSAGSNV